MTLKNRRRTSLKARMLGATRLNASTVIGSPRISDPSIGEHHRRVVEEEGGGGGGPASDGLLLELGDYILLESGDFLLME